METKIYDLIIIGAGPAGLTAGIYGIRDLLKVLIIGERQGGAISESNKVHNFPSYEEISGMELSMKIVEQVKKLGVDLKQGRVEKISKKGEQFKVKVDNKEYISKKLILAIGREKRKLNVPGEKEFSGKGVNYCATCDAAFYKNKVVAVVGGGDSALTAALLLAGYATKVYIIYRKDKFFRAHPTWVKLTNKNKKIKSLFNSEVKQIKGKENVEKVILNDKSELKLDGIFIEIGSVPDETLSKQLRVETKEKYILIDKSQRTNIKGVFAAGDITDNPLKQVITACAEGAIAADSAYKEIKKQNDV